METKWLRGFLTEYVFLINAALRVLNVLIRVLNSSCPQVDCLLFGGLGTKGYLSD